MYLYAIFGLLAFLAFLDVLIKPENRTAEYGVTYRCATFLLFLLSALRWEIGTDWESYADYFELASDRNFEGWMEPGFTLLNKWVAWVTKSYAAMVVVTAAIVYLLNPKALYRLSPYPFVALLTWYAITIANVFPVRATIASSILLYSYLFIRDRRPVPFFIALAAASTFHLSSLIFASAYFVYPIRLNRYWLVALFAGSFVVALTAEGFMSNILGSISSPLIQGRLDGYLDAGPGESYGQKFSPRQVMLRGFVNRSMIMFVIAVLLDRLRRKDPFLNGLVNLFVLASVLAPLLTAVNVALARLTIFFDLAQLLIFSYLFSLKMNRGNRIILFVILGIYFLYRFYGVVENYRELYIPYRSWLMNY